ncbi:sulfate adenylyltransferase subunit 1 [Actinoplanes sp. TFC3]|uniref:sulfate adenylyltransferase subunit 1 n=1 Tax=Actinoplanes sp. TFC3 TaxID=1710355 RepID=UPI000836F5ED|nr:GTP-binding protein [Actinoplanes sp. TFC3]
MDILRLATAGSVDDGKSTLIGRLLYDTQTAFEDQIDAVARASRRTGGDGEQINLALLTDGLKAEREQGITIDVAYRYFATPRRKFIIADTPGHVQYTRNMVTGASTAELAIVLVDARGGMTEQSRRHALLCSLLGVPHLVLAINKMDLVDYDEAAFRAIDQEFSRFSERLRIPDLSVIPMSALEGDNVVQRTTKMPWYEGPSLLHHLETVHVAADTNLIDLRFPVQYVIRPQTTEFHDYRGYAGKIATGVIRVGDEVIALPSGMTSKVTAIDSPAGPVEEAYAPMSVTVRLADDIDLSRGDTLTRVNNQPRTTQDIDAMVCWMAPEELRPGMRVLVKHTTRTVPALVKDIEYRMDVNTLHRAGADSLGFNDIGRIRLRTTQPLMCDDYQRSRQTGGFIVIDPTTKRTLGGGMIRLP